MVLKLTIITINLNNLNGLKETIRSIESQSFKDYEHLIIDGKSSDGSLNLIKAYQKRQQAIGKPVRYVHEKDKGIYNAMNKGIKLAKGEFIYFLNSGDTILKNSLTDIFQQVTKNTLFIYGNVKKSVSGHIYDGEFSLPKLFTNNICHQAIIYNKDIFPKFGFFNEKYKIRADYALNIKVFNSKIPIKYIPIVIANYLEGGISQNSFDFAFWEDYKQNYIIPFVPILGRKKVYNMLWRYYYKLVDKGASRKALVLALKILLNTCDFEKGTKGLWYLIKTKEWR
jgi:glycosyltransferase involved in cell wall biosynthesis